MRSGHNTAFYLETMLLIVVFILMILLLTGVFGLAQTQSSAAEHLTDAVTLAGNAAEKFAAADGAETLLQLLDENGNAFPREDTAGMTAFYDRDLNPEADGIYRVELTWQPDPMPGPGTMFYARILVYAGTAEEPVYTLQTAKYRQEAEA